ncbi:MAG: Fic family protein [Oscillospiraceae bacterium]|nr:Fic family protein [Oscillospiraceae bacterium]
MFQSEYTPLAPNQDMEKRQKYWEIGKGLQATDGLQTSAYLETVIADTLANKYNTEQAAEKVYNHYTAIDPDSAEYRHKEADIVAARITVCLEREDFKLSPISLKVIHRELFQDVLPFKWVGEYRTENLSKKEPVLNDASMVYGDFNAIPDYLRYDFDTEQNAKYNTPFQEEDVHKFAKFISTIWQAHPFREGNTRTISTFAIKYLRTMGVQVDNAPFEEHSKWFRDALVRANHIDAQNNIRPNVSYLNKFFENVILGAGHNLQALDLRPSTSREGNN